MNNTVAGLAWGLLAVGAGELVQATAMHHVRRFAACLLAGVLVAGGVAVFTLSHRHQQLAAAAAAAHESLAHLMASALGLLAAVVTVAGYIAVTVMAGRRRRTVRVPDGRW